MATDGTQYLIELAAKFSGGDTAVATLAELGDRMLAGGATAKEFEQATIATSAALEKAAAASLAANAAVAAGNDSYRSAEIAASRAAAAVDNLGAKAQAQVGKLEAALAINDTDAIEAAEAKIWKLLGRQEQAAAASLKAADALKVEAAALDAVKEKADAASETHDDLKKGLANVNAAAVKSAQAEKAISGSGNLNDIANAVGKIGGPAGAAGQKVLGMAQSFSKLKGAMGAGGPYVAVALAIVAVATAAIAATIALAQYGVTMSDANRTQTLLTAGIARSVEGGAALSAEFDKIARVVPVTNDELTSMSKKLADSGLRGEELNAALEQTAVEAATLKFGPDFQKELTSLGSSSKRLESNLAKMFGGLNIEKLLSGLSTLVDLFDTSSESGEALKFLFEALFQPLIDGASDAIPWIERLFLYAEILALKAFIALKPYSGILLAIGKGFLVVAAIVAGTLAVAIGAIIVNFIAMGVAIAAIGYAIYEVIAVIAGFVSAFMEGGLEGAVDYLKDLGTRMMEGLVNGITGAASAVVKAITDVVSGGIAAAKRALGIGSPSKVFAGIGDYTAQGFAEGVEGGSGDAQGAMEAMVAPPAPGASGSRLGGGGGVSLTIGELHVHGEGAKEQADNFIEQITSWLEGAGITVGGGEVPG